MNKKIIKFVILCFVIVTTTTFTCCKEPSEVENENNNEVNGTTGNTDDSVEDSTKDYFGTYEYKIEYETDKFETISIELKSDETLIMKMPVFQVSFSSDDEESTTTVSEIVSLNGTYVVSDFNISIKYDSPNPSEETRQTMDGYTTDKWKTILFSTANGEEWKFEKK